MKVSPSMLYGFVTLAGQLAKLPPNSIEVTPCPMKKPEEIKLDVRLTPETFRLIWSEMPEAVRALALAKVPWIKELVDAEVLAAAAVDPGAE